MHPDLESAISALGLSESVPTLRSNAEISRNLVEAARVSLQRELSDLHSIFDVVAVGSIAREEASNESDFDYLAIAHGLPPKASHAKEVMRAAENVRKQLKLEPPGDTGMFGKVIAGAELTERIGLQEDTNLSHSRRILLLEESVSLFQPAKHQQLIELILDRYLADYETPKRGVPRFLLNDVVRYWRTMAVDYQAKRWEKLQPEWGLRYLKLIVSRKLSFAGALVPLFLCDIADAERLRIEFEKPALARLASLQLRLEPELLGSLRLVLEIAEEFAALLKDKDFRNSAKAIGERRDIVADSPFAQMRDRARKLQEALERMFFESRVLGDKSRRYLSF